MSINLPNLARPLVHEPTSPFYLLNRKVRLLPKEHQIEAVKPNFI